MDTERVRKELEAITRMIWEPLLPGRLECIPDVPGERSNDPTRVSCVHILGGWQGSVSVQCGVPIADAVSRVMLSLGDGELTRDDWESVLKELANVTGGNTKSALGEGCILSTPVARETTGFSFSVPETPEVMKLCFKSKESFLVVRLHEGSLDLSEVLS